jgi:hypothetical protein
MAGKMMENIRSERHSVLTGFSGASDMEAPALFESFG